MPSLIIKKLEQMAEIAQRLMDDMIDLELEQIAKILAKIESDPESDEVKLVEKELWLNIRKACIEGRRTGLGITALGDAIAALNVRYGSKESIEITEMIYKSLAVGSYRSSCKMAKIVVHSLFLITSLKRIILICKEFGMPHQMYMNCIASTVAEISLT
jgi:hypothetical protein